MVRMNAIPLEREIEYPSSDGKPMAETELHFKEMVALVEALVSRFEDEPDVYVCGNMLLYYVEGDPRFSVAPDVFLIRGVPKKVRETYLLWKEGRPPSFVLEVTSRTTRREDLGKKKSLYERLGVEEYFLHDPLGDYLTPRLQGFRLVQGRYQPLTAATDGSLRSTVTGLIYRAEGTDLYLVDPETGEILPSTWALRPELKAAHETIEQQNRDLARQTQEIERLRAELARSRGEQPG
jgi:Uma2 family endonuclease